MTSILKHRLLDNSVCYWLPSLPRKDISSLTWDRHTWYSYNLLLTKISGEITAFKSEGESIFNTRPTPIRPLRSHPEHCRLYPNVSLYQGVSIFPRSEGAQRQVFALAACNQSALRRFQNFVIISRNRKKASRAAFIGALKFNHGAETLAGMEEWYNSLGFKAREKLGLFSFKRCRQTTFGRSR